MVWPQPRNFNSDAMVSAYRLQRLARHSTVAPTDAAGGDKAIQVRRRHVPHTWMM